MSEPATRRRKRGEVDVPTDVMAEPSQPSPLAQVKRPSTEAAVAAMLDERFADLRQHLDIKLGALGLALMLDERFAELRRDIDLKLDAITTHLSNEVEKLSMRAVEVGDVSKEPLVESVAAPSTLAELWWEHVGNVWPTPQEELSLDSINRTVEIAAAAHGFRADELFVALLQRYAVQRVGGERTAVDLQLHLHEYLADTIATEVAVTIATEVAK